MSWAAVGAAGVGVVGGALLGGGTDNTAARYQRAQNQEGREYTMGMVRGARNDLNAFYPAARQALTDGTLSALQVLSGTIPAQFNSFARGNMNAQNTLLAGMPMQQAAILGTPVYNYLPQMVAQQQGPRLDMFQGNYLRPMPTIQRPEMTPVQSVFNRTPAPEVTAMNALGGVA